jgi:hypothetical protein
MCSGHPLEMLKYFEKIIVWPLEDMEKLEMSCTRDAHWKWYKILENYLEISYRELQSCMKGLTWVMD